MTLASQAFGSSFSFNYKFADIFNLNAPDAIFTSVQFDNQSTDCMVDTGARFSIAKESFLASNVKVGEVLGGGVSGQQRVADLVESKVQFGNWTNASRVIGRTNQIPADCLIGNDFFLDRTIFIDFTEKTFSDEKSFTGTTFPLQKYISDRGGHFGFHIEIAGNSVPSLFDTGATDTVVDIDFVEAHPENFKFVKEVEIQEGSNQSIKVGLCRLKSMKMGTIDDTNVEVYVLSLKYLQSKIPGIQAVIGLSQMTKHNWYIDNKNSVWGNY